METSPLLIPGNLRGREREPSTWSLITEVTKEKAIMGHGALPLGSRIQVTRKGDGL